MTVTIALMIDEKQRAAERLEDERTLQKEEENVGRRVEEHNAQERSQWEAVYGDKELSKSNGQESNRDSGVGDMDSQKRGAMSTVTSLRRSGDEDIEMAEAGGNTRGDSEIEEGEDVEEGEHSGSEHGEALGRDMDES